MWKWFSLVVELKTTEHDWTFYYYAADFFSGGDCLCSMDSGGMNDPKMINEDKRWMQPDETLPVVTYTEIRNEGFIEERSSFRLI